MTEASIDEMTGAVAALLEDRLRLRGETLGEKLRRGRRALPRRLRKDAELLAEAELLWSNPRLHPRIDRDRVTRAHDNLKAYLRSIGTSERRKRLALSILGSIAFNLLTLIALLLAVLVWRGYL